MQSIDTTMKIGYRVLAAVFCLGRAFLPAPLSASFEESQADSAAMREMYMTEPPPFDEVIAVLADVERRING